MNNSKRQSRVWLVFAFVCMMASAALGQVVTATISGNVTDTNGGAVPGATVTITNSETGAQAFTGQTNDEGFYNAPGIPIGTYNIAIEGQGFKRTEISGVRLTVDQRARIDAALETGGVAEVVTVVSDNAGQIERDTSSQSQVLDTNRIRDLPTLDRNPLNLLNLVAGVSTGGSLTDISSQQISINGSRTSNNEFTVDGISVTQGGTGRPTALPSSEALREFRVLTSAYSAEYGRTSGGFISAVVDSGTRRFRGRLYEFFRNEALNANPYFRNANRLPRQRDRQHLFGVRLDGPVILPRFGEGGPALTTNRDRTFFLFNYEGLRRTSPAFPTGTVPDQALRNGDFSGVGSIIRDPLTGQPFPGNIIPQNRIDPAARQILGLIPLPNATGTRAGSVTANNFIFSQTTDRVDNQINVRIDHNFTETARLFGRFTYINQDIEAAQNIPGILGGFNTGDNTIKTPQLAIGYTQSLTPSLLFEFTGGYVRENFNIVPVSQGIDVPSVLGIQRTAANVAPTITISGFTALGTQNNSTQAQITNTYQGQASLSYVRGNLTTKFGGQYRLNEYNVFFPGNGYAGIYNFNGAFTARNFNAVGGDPAQAFADFLLGLPRNASYQLPQSAVSRRNTYAAFFVQNDWKATDRLTLNLGLRYDFETPLRIKNNVYSRVDPFTGRLLVATDNESLIGQTVNPVQLPALPGPNPFCPGAPANNICRNDPRIGQTLIAGEYSDKYLGLRTDRNNFGPRVGLAYSLDDKTVVRAAFGVFFTPLFSNFGGSVNFTGFAQTANFGNINDTVGGQQVAAPQPFTLSQGIPLVLNPTADPFSVLNTNAVVNGQIQGLPQSGLSFFEFDPTPYVMQWNAGIQREIFRGNILDVSYVASRGKHLPLQFINNNVPFELGAFTGSVNDGRGTQFARPNPLLSAIFTINLAGNSQYDSLQAKITRQFGRTFSYSATYTFSKSFDDGSGLFNGTQPQNFAPFRNVLPGFDPRLERGLSSFDRPHVFNLGAQFENRFGPRFLRNIVFNPIVIARSGTPLTITGANTAPGVFFQQRPSVRNGFSYEDLYVGQPTPTGNSIRYLRAPAVRTGTGNAVTANPDFPFRPSGPFFNGATQVLPSEYPNVPRNVVRGPGEFSANLSAGRIFRFNERVSVQLRAEFFNVFNNVNFANPNLGLGAINTAADGSLYFNSPDFGLITDTRPPRQGQLVIRLDF